MHNRMNDRHGMILAAALSAGLALLVGCDRKAGPAAPPAMMAVSASPADSPVPTGMSLSPLATLHPGRPTMLAAMPGGSIFALQSESSGENSTIVEIATGEGSPRPTTLTADSVLQVLGVAKGTGTEGGSGRFTAIAPSADGRLAFSFAGVAGTRPFAALGTYTPATQQLFVSVDFITLASVDAELATDVARPSLFTDGDDAWLWRTAGSEVRLLMVEGLSKPRPKLSASRVSLEQVKDVVARSAWEWSATPTRGEFLLTDTASRWIRKVDASSAIAHIARFDETVTTITPAALDAAGRIIVLGNDRDGITTCALVQNEDAFKAIDRATFAVTGLNAAAPLRLDRLYPVPAERNAFVAYDATSGRVLRVDFK